MIALVCSFVFFRLFGYVLAGLARWFFVRGATFGCVGSHFLRIDAPGWLLCALQSCNGAVLSEVLISAGFFYFLFSTSSILKCSCVDAWRLPVWLSVCPVVCFDTG